jgi:HSP20 family protein
MYLSNLMRGIDPWREMGRIQREMNRMFQGIGSDDRRIYPLVNIWTNPEKAIATVELPGYDSNKIDISVVADELLLKGERTAPELKKEECCHRQERREGVFERRIQLPFNVDSSKVEAEFNNGILKISLPRIEVEKPKKIQIKVS